MDESLSLYQDGHHACNMVKTLNSSPLYNQKVNDIVCLTRLH